MGTDGWLFELSAQEIGGDDIMHSPVNLKLHVLADQFQDNLKAFNSFEPCDITPMLPGVDCEQLQGALWGQWVTQLLLTLRRERQLWWIQ